MLTYFSFFLLFSPCFDSRCTWCILTGNGYGQLYFANYVGLGIHHDYISDKMNFGLVFKVLLDQTESVQRRCLVL
jgi:hypothetical protein